MSGMDLHSTLAPLCESVLGGIAMANLKQEYIDIKDVKHRVEHLTIPEQENSDREQLVQELLILLTKSSEKLPT